MSTAAPAVVPRHVAVAANAAVLLGFRPPIASAIPHGCLGQKHGLKRWTEKLTNGDILLICY